MDRLDFVILLSVAVPLCLLADGGRNVAGGEDLELKTQSKLPIQTVKNELGHIYDCLDIQQQPALDHPLLKNHKVQMKPTSYPEPLAVGKKLKDHIMPLLMTVKCPQGTVPIRRIGKEELARINSFNGTYLPNINIHPQTDDYPGKQFNILKTYGRQNTYHGASAVINVQQPIVNDLQASATQIYVETTVDGEFNSLQAGWIVSPQLYGDHLTHLFGFWGTTSPDGHKQGCFNTYCPGFIQTNPNIPIDMVLQPISVYGGQAYEIKVKIFRDPKTANWWLSYLNNNLGYWPSSIVPRLAANGAMYLAWGGVASTIPGEPSPPLGSGRPFNYTWFNPTKQSYIRNVRITDGGLHDFIPRDNQVETYISNKKCYGLWNLHYRNEVEEYTFSFGGQGGDCGL